ncbi:FAD-dependent oxidoreductase [Arenimonas sp. GDDSR-1]|uniref:NAD(P)/FAD-dependent oxidoreductase n=1 Tax=Arenimonas sp. GDDSR-1 TaxID=2950125 RepID=UPI00262F5E4E|nr:FAD-dependent oxidoreductase [Arenimonas sp. GDDSR-1]
MKIAIIGSGIAGISAAWKLCRQHEVVLFEKESRLGGHTHTHDIALDGNNYRIDSGFIVHNPENYPLFSGFLKDLGVPTKPTEMSFAVHNRALGMYYNAHDLGGLFCQKRNLLSPPFWRMLADIRRFYAECPALLASDQEGPALGDYLDANGYSPYFVHNHLIPMASALWSSPSQRILDFPAKYLVAFMANHHMLQISDRPLWRVLENGSSSYIEKLSGTWPVSVRLNAPVQQVTRTEENVSITTPHGTEHFDQVIFACHSDQTLMMLGDADDNERSILGAIRYQANETVLHCDASVLPPDRRAWAAWNADIPDDPAAPCSLNQRSQIDPAKIFAIMQYHHPVYDHAMVRAQSRRHEIQGKRRSWFCGAYWGFGFHEDGFRSGHEAAEGILAP